MNKAITHCLILTYSFLPQTSKATYFQNNDFKKFQLAQSQGDQVEEFDELGQYAVSRPAYTRSAKRFGFRVFGGFNFASDIKSRYNENLSGRISSNTSTEYILPHKNLLGSVFFGAGAFLLFTERIGLMFAANYEIESKVEEYKYSFNDKTSFSTSGCYVSSKDQNYLLCPLFDQFWYSIISLELSGYYQFLPLLYIFAGPNFFIPIGFKYQSRRGNLTREFAPRIKGGIGGQVGIGGAYQGFFIEALFKTQNLILEGIRFDSTGGERRFGGGILETGRLWGFMVRGGFQF